MTYSKSKPDAKPSGLIHIVVYHADRDQKAAAFTSREMAEAFAESKSNLSTQAGEQQRYTILETIVDGQAVGAPIEN